MVGLVLICLFLALGHLVKELTKLPLPPNVIGLLLLFCALRSGLLPVAWIENASRCLLRHMMLFFTPAIVGAGFLIVALSHQWFAISVSLVGSTMIGLLCAGWLMQYSDKGNQRRSLENEQATSEVEEA